MTNHNYCILLAGGVGKRLWPVSRERKPKQFIDFFGIGKTLLQLTFERFATFLPVENIYISTFAEYVDTVREQLPQLPAENILRRTHAAFHRTGCRMGYLAHRPSRLRGLLRRHTG